MDDNWIRRLNALQLIVAGVIIVAPVVWIGAVLVQAVVRSHGLSADAVVFADGGKNYAQLFKPRRFSYGVNSLIVIASIGGARPAVRDSRRLRGVRPGFWPAILTWRARMAPGTLFLLHGTSCSAGRHDRLLPALILSHAGDHAAIVIWVSASFDNIHARVRGGAGRWLQRHAHPVRIALLWSARASRGAILAFVFPGIISVSRWCCRPATADADHRRFNFVGEGSTQWGRADGGGDPDPLPPLVLAARVQRWLVSGLTLRRGERFRKFEDYPVRSQFSIMQAAVFSRQ